MAVRTAISLCTGIGMLDHGVELALRLTGRTLVPLLYVEKEAFRAANLVWQMEQGLLASAPIWSDVALLGHPRLAARAWIEAARREPGVDLLFGGIPCQPHSQAGKRLGADDSRDLWPATRRAVAIAQPRRVFIENVSGICRANEPDGGGARMVRDLEDLGYRVTFGFFSSEECGASHGRLRWFLAAAMADTAERGGVCEAAPSWAGGAGRGHAAGASAELADATQQQRRREESARSRGHDHGSSDYLPCYAPPRNDWPAWLAVARTRPDLLPAHGTQAFECEFQRVAFRLADLPDGHANRAHRLSAVGDGVDPATAALAFLSLEACLG